MLHLINCESNSAPVKPLHIVRHIECRIMPAKFKLKCNTVLVLKSESKKYENVPTFNLLCCCFVGLVVECNFERGSIVFHPGQELNNAIKQPLMERGNNV